MLHIENVHATAGEKCILNGLSLHVAPGEVHAIMGPNGSGKSTLSNIIAGHEDYEITEGAITFEGEDLAELDPDARAHKGIFMAFQYPVAIPGVSNRLFVQTALNSIREANGEVPLDSAEFQDYVDETLATLPINAQLLERDVNVGFSGGEKKRNDIFQMALLKPRLAILDETDSGLDIDALRTVADGVNAMRDGKRAFIVITHYQRLLNYIKPDHVHVLADGKIIRSGDKNLALDLEQKGYSWLT